MLRAGETPEDSDDVWALAPMQEQLPNSNCRRITRGEREGGERRMLLE